MNITFPRAVSLAAQYFFRIKLIDPRYSRERHGRHYLLRSYKLSRIQRGPVEPSIRGRIWSVLQLAFDLWQAGYVEARVKLP